MQGTEEECATAVLRRARQHLQRGWCRHHVAVDADDKPVAYDSADAVAVCAMGAIFRATAELVTAAEERCRIVEATRDRLLDVLPRQIGSIGWYNNFCVQQVEELLQRFDRAIGGK